jgi:hypothetical protein
MGMRLVDPDNPGHRDAIKTVSHVDDDKHDKFIAWIHNEIHKLDHGNGPPA